MRRPSLLPKKETFLDDRGAPLHLAPEQVMVGAIWGSTPRAIWLRRVPMFVIFSVAFVQILIHNQPPTLDQVAVPFLFVLVVALIFPARLRSQHAKRKPQSILASILAAHRMCGACGYSLREVAPASDGCVVCPECGAAWHQDRFVFADQDAASSDLLSKQAGLGHTLATDRTCDDRGLPMKRPIGWPPKWFPEHAASLEVVEGMRAIAKRKLDTFHKRWIGPSLVAWGFLCWVLFQNAHDPDRDVLLTIMVITAIIALLLYYVAVRVYIDFAMVRQAVDTFAACNSCGALLPHDGPVTFDKCVVCTLCKGAWKRRGAAAHQLPRVRPLNESSHAKEG